MSTMSHLIVFFSPFCLYILTKLLKRRVKREPRWYTLNKRILIISFVWDTSMSAMSIVLIINDLLFQEKLISSSTPLK